MDINAIAMWLMVSVIGLYTWRAYLHQGDVMPSKLPWVPIQVGKQRSFVNQQRDAGMHIEKVRRSAILTNQSHLFSHKDSTNGYLEYGLTSILIGPPRPVVEPEIIWSGGDADDQISDVVDGGNAFSMFDAIDFGNAFSVFFVGSA
jgi:hypothetical protein